MAFFNGLRPIFVLLRAASAIFEKTRTVRHWAINSRLWAFDNGAAAKYSRLAARC